MNYGYGAEFFIRAKKMKKTKRSIFFYTLKGTNTFTGQNTEDVDLIEVLKEINKLPHKNGINGKYLESRGYPELSLQEASFRNNLCMGKIGFRRTHDLPYKENGGSEKPLLLSPGECLFEPSHFVLLKNKVLGIEYNHHGPKAANLRIYIERKGFGNVSEVKLAYLIKPDVMKKLKKMKILTSVKIKVEQSGLQALSVIHDSIKKGAKSLLEINEGINTVEFTLNAVPRKKDRGFTINHLVKNLGKALGTDSAKGITKFEVKGIDSEFMKTDEVNVLSDKIVSKKTVEIKTTDHRYIDSADMYQKIIDAYEENKDDIQNSIRSAE